MPGKSAKCIERDARGNRSTRSSLICWSTRQRMSFHPVTGTSLGVSAARPRSRSVSAVRSASPPLSDSSSFFAPGSGLLPLSATRRLWSETGLGSSPDLTRPRREAARTNASPIRSAQRLVRGSPLCVFRCEPGVATAMMSPRGGHAGLSLITERQQSMFPRADARAERVETRQVKILAPYEPKLQAFLGFVFLGEYVKRGDELDRRSSDTRATRLRSLRRRPGYQTHSSTGTSTK